jgi:drug/metabolite transporter (DMT)-like permease
MELKAVSQTSLSSLAKAPSRRKGVLLMIGAGLCWSTGGILVRSVVLTDPWEIIFWRSVFMVIFMMGVLTLWHRAKVMEKIFEVGLPGILAGALLASTFFFFILSVTRNTVANTLVLMSVGPFFVALSGRIFLGEMVSLRTWGTISAALVGIVLMFSEGLDSGRTIGNLLALGVPVAFGLNVVILRRTHASVSMAPTVMLAGIFSIVVSFPFAWPFTPTLRDFVVLGVMGWVQLGIGCVLMVMAARYLSAAEIGLFALLETILGPVWVWLGFGERPTDMALVGGLIVISALLLNGMLGMRERSSAG